jgi:hypothetical protein
MNLPGAARDWLGHSSVKVSERYAHLEARELEDAAVLLARTAIRAAPDCRAAQQ